jgi:hypothetical protein
MKFICTNEGCNPKCILECYVFYKNDVPCRCVIAGGFIEWKEYHDPNDPYDEKWGIL